jgi:type VI secretion system protein ImpE
MVWTAAQFTWANGGEAVGLIPTRYPATANQDDDRLKLARMTQWQQIAEGEFEGLGQRVLATDVDEHSLLEVREIVLHPPSEDTPTADSNG